MLSNSTDLAYRRNEDRARDGIPTIIVCTAIALLFVALRIYTRAFRVRQVFWEDYAIVVALAFSIFLAVFLVIAFTNGAGRHFETVSPAEFSRIMRFAPAVYIGYLSVHAFIKLSIILQYLRISVMVFEKRFCYVLSAILGCWYLTFVISSLTRCIPLHALWVPNVPGAVCAKTTISMTTSQILIFTMDFIILIGPLFILRHLNIPWQQRVLLGLVLAFGAMASIISIMRLQVLYLSTTSTDKTWDSVPSGLYGVIETTTGISCSCIVTLRPLFRRLRWLSKAGKAEPVLYQVEPERQKPRHRDDLFSLGTGSTRVLAVPNDVELGTVYTNSCAGSTKADGGTGEGGKVPSVEAPSPVRVGHTTASQASPAAQSAPQRQGTTPRFWSNDGVRRQQAAMIEGSNYQGPSDSLTPAA